MAIISSPTSPDLSGVALAKTEGPSSAAVVGHQLQECTSLVDAAICYSSCTHLVWGIMPLHRNFFYNR